MARKIACGVAIFVLLVPFICSAQTNVLTYHNDYFHTGQNLSETILTQLNVNVSTFGLRFVMPGDGKIEGQPLYVARLTIPGNGVHNVVFVATEHDTVYAYDADQSGEPLWRVSMLPAGETPSDTLGCSQVEPEIGVTATPIIDLAAGSHGTIYLVAMSKDSAGGYHQRLHALDLTSGEEEFNGPVEISAVFPGGGDNSRNGLVHFDPMMYKERAALVISKGVVYTSWTSHCDARPYTGWLIGYDQYSLAQVLVYNFAPNGEGGTIWGAGAGPAIDADGNLFFQTANGTFDRQLDGGNFPAGGDYGNSFVKLSVKERKPAVLDYWTMHNSIEESDADVDLGSGGIMLLPDLVDANGTVRHLGTGAGKDGNVYMFNRDNLGKFNGSGDVTLYQELPNALANAQFAVPAWFNGNIYFGAIGDHIRAFTVSSARLSTAPPVMTQASFGYPGASPSISANGTNNPILWAFENTDPVVLHAYDANDLSRELYNSRQAGGRDAAGAGAKWIPPTIADGKVFVPTTTGVAVFGLLPVTRSPRPFKYPNALIPD
jgi:hypothetical protein